MYYTIFKYLKLNFISLNYHFNEFHNFKIPNGKKNLFIYIILFLEKFK
jgi:hypothetical protein